MDQSGDRIFIYHTDPEMDRLLLGNGLGQSSTCHFSQNEDFFLKLAEEIVIPSLPIHHDVRLKTPDSRSRTKIQGIIVQLVRLIPETFAGMRWYFDATETLCLDFFQILTSCGETYLSIMRIDLTFRSSMARLITAGTNDQTAHYATNRLFIEADIITLRSYQENQQGQFEFRINQTVSGTWVGETGRGYFVMGIWLDRELTKFFSRLFQPKGKRLYPYYPLNCRFQAVCFQPYDLSLLGRQRAVALLQSCRRVIEPRIRDIEAALRKENFSEELPGFKIIQQTISPELIAYFQPLSIQSYLNQDDFKEYELKYET